MHRLLQRQLRKHLGPGVAIAPEWQSLLAAVEDAYHQYDRDRQLLDRASRLSSEELRVARDAANAASHAKSHFLANVSHEIRTPLNAIVGMSDLLLRQTLSAEQREMAELIRNGGHALGDVINDVLDFSAIEAGKLTLVSEPFEVRSSLNQVVGLFTSRCVEKQLGLRLQVEPALPALVRGDGGRLRQILIHLVGNAVKFTDRGAVTSHVRWKSDGNRGRLTCAIQDTGIGIPADRIGEIFQSFSQLDPSRTRRHGGAGLGLAISHRLITLMAGAMSVESDEGRGSIFTFNVELGVVAEATRAENPAPSLVDAGFAAAHPLRILVVDDHPVNRKLAVALLRRLGYEPTTADDGEDALRQFAREPADLVLMDVQMPVMDGLEATRRLRATHSSDEKPFIAALTANVRPEDRAACVKADMNDFLGKPLGMEALMATLLRAHAVTRIRAEPSLAAVA